MKFFASVFLLGLVGRADAESSSKGDSSSKICLPDCSKGSCVFDVNVVLTAGQLGKDPPGSATSFFLSTVCALLNQTPLLDDTQDTSTLKAATE
jgi:hypothetical protein